MDSLSWPAPAGEGHTVGRFFLILSPLYYQFFLRPLHLHLQIHTIVILVKISITYFSPTVVDSIGSALGEELGLTDGELLGILLGAQLG